MEGGRGRTPSSCTGSGMDGGAESYANVLVCFICMEPPVDPVAASCGHVFCWPCMYRWLQNQPKPCPVCRNLLRRDLDIIPLSGAGDRARAGTTSGNTRSNSSPGESTNPDSDSAMIPPRPRNPLLLVEDITVTPEAGAEDPNQLVLTPNSVLAAYETSLHELSDALVEERMQVRTLTTERANLELDVHDWEQRNATLRRRVQDIDWQIFVLRNRRVQREGDLEERNARLEREVEESRQREQWLAGRENEMRVRIGSLQQRLARAESRLASGV